MREACDPKTGERKVKSITYKKVGCQCVKDVNVAIESCACPPPRVVREKCKPGMKFAKTIEYKYELGNEQLKKCRKITNLLREDPCECPMPGKEEKCENGVIIIRKSNPQMMERNGITYCDKRYETKEKVVNCIFPDTKSQTKTITSSPCQNHIRELHVERLFLNKATCSCKKIVRKMLEACDCEALNSEYTKCHKGIKSSGCQAANEQGVGKESITVTEFTLERCRCIKRSRNFERICKAPEPVIKKHCIPDKGIVVEIKRVFTINQAEVRFSYFFTKCPAAKEWRSDCVEGYLTLKRQEYQLIDGKCVSRASSLKVRCACPKPFDRKYCDGEGNWVKCLSQFRYNPEGQGSCELLKQCTRWPKKCPEPRKIVRSGCSSENGYRKSLYLETYQLNKKDCTCSKHVSKTWTEFCKCDHLDTVSHKCLNERKLVTTVKHTLKSGQCIPTKVETIKEFNCPSPKVSTLECIRDKRDANYGHKMRTIQYFVREHCRCVPKIKIERKVCDCSLLAEPFLTKKCVNDTLLQVKKHMHYFNNDKCVPGTVNHWLRIKCDIKDRSLIGTDGRATKVIFSACKPGEGGHFYRVKEVLTPVVRNCKCVWQLMHKSLELCQCRPDAVKMVCRREGTELLQVSESFILVEERGARKCNAKTDVKVLSFCSPNAPLGKWFIVSEGVCNPQTCKRQLEVKGLVKKDCKCQIERTTISESCCCPQKQGETKQCLPGNILQTNYFTFKLAARDMDPETGAIGKTSFCQKVVRSLKTQVDCAGVKPKVEMTQCADKFRLAKVYSFEAANCQCRFNEPHTFRIPCGCPEKVLIVRGNCANDGYAMDQLMVLAPEDSSFDQGRIQCKPIKLLSFRRRCSCQEPQTIARCVSDSHNAHYKEIVRTSYQFDETNNNCIRKSDTEKQLISQFLSRP
ncbi:hypothetical protein Ciccas_001065 [Cichlidogyrus casuarinus]|uniref:Uncharacterized protein n=1 Tax=Cichlidogyrus casuarinus TaxID=1844966 RepID=A0ABD2QMA0_9PLAT